MESHNLLIRSSNSIHELVIGSQRAADDDDGTAVQPRTLDPRRPGEARDRRPWTASAPRGRGGSPSSAGSWGQGPRQGNGAHRAARWPCGRCRSPESVRAVGVPCGDKHPSAGHVLWASLRQPQRPAGGAGGMGQGPQHHTPHLAGGSPPPEDRRWRERTHREPHGGRFCRPVPPPRDRGHRAPLPSGVLGAHLTWGGTTQSQPPGHPAQPSLWGREQAWATGGGTQAQPWAASLQEPEGLCEAGEGQGTTRRETERTPAPTEGPGTSSCIRRAPAPCPHVPALSSPGPGATAGSASG